MKQENIKKVMEQIRSKKNNENEQVATAGEAFLNVTNETQLSVASASVNKTIDLSTGGYLYLDSYDQDGNVFEIYVFGYYNDTCYALVGMVDVEALLAANNIDLDNLTECYLHLYSEAGEYNATYDIYDANGTYIGSDYGETELYVPLKEIYESSGSWEFMLVPNINDCGGIYVANYADLEIAYSTAILTGIQVTTQPNKTEYLEGETFDKTGMVVKATYSDGSRKTITNYTMSPSGALALNNTQITISYKGKTATVAIEVKPALTEISITKMPDELHYVEGEKFNASGMVVQALYNDGSTQEVTGYTCTPDTTLTAGDQLITVSYTENGITKTKTLWVDVAKEKIGYYGNRNISVSNYGENPIWNLQTLGMRYLQSGLSIGMNSYTIGANLIYDSQMRNKLKNLCVGMPNGWKLDVHQFVVKDGKDDNNVDTYKYIDGQGYVHTFERYVGSTIEYYDTEGASLVLTVSNGYVIKDKNNNEIYFDTSGRLIKTVSGTNDKNKKIYTYNTDGTLDQIYDERKVENLVPTRYIKFGYNNGQLDTIKTYDDSQEFEKLTLSCPSGNITSITKTKNGVSGSKTISVFTYDENGKLQLIVDKETNNAVFVTHRFDAFRSDYSVKQQSRGIVDANNNFTEKTFEKWYYSNTYSEIKAYREVAFENEKGVKIARKMDAEGNIEVSFERISNDEYKTFDKSVGIKLTYQTPSTSSVVFNGENSGSLYSSNTTSTQVQLTLANTSTDLKSARYYTLSFWLNYASVTFEKLYACISYKVSGTEYKVYRPVDVKLVSAWQKLTLPIDLQNLNGEFSDMKLSFVTFNANNAEIEEKIYGYVGCFRMNAGVSSKLKIGGKDFDGITKIVTVANNTTETIYVKATDHKFTESDFIRSVESYNLKQKNGVTNWDFYYDNGKKRIRNCTAVTIYVGNTSYNFLTLASQAKQTDANNYLWWMETHSADDRVMSKQYQAYNTIGCLTVTKTKIGDGEEQTTEQQGHYKSWDREITEENGATVKREYFEDGNLKKETIIGKDENNNNIEIVVYEATRDSTGEYIRQETGTFDSKNYTFSKFSLDKMERSRYNGVTYKETYGYDGFEEYLEKVTAYFGTTQKAQNQMYYGEGELSDVTDGKVRYHFNVDKGGYSDTVTWKVYDESWKTLEEIETEHEGNDVTQTYYRNDSSTPTDTLVYTKDQYGKPISISYNGAQKVTYTYTNAGESQAAWLLASVNDQFCGRTYAYTYNADGSQKSVSMTGFAVEKVNESEKKYTVGTDTITQKIVQDTKPRAITYTCNGTTIPVFDRYYAYDNFGRMQIKQGAQLANLEEENGEVISQTTYGYSNGHMLPTSETYNRGSETKYAATYTYDARGNIQKIVDNHGTTTYTYDALNRLTKENSKTYSYDASGRMSSFNGTAMDYDDRGRLETFGDIRFEYDNYGNRTKKKNKNTDEILCSYEWTRGRLLASVGSTTFEYDAKGRRTKKGSTEYYYDGDRLIAEIRPTGTLYFFYDESGVCGMRCNGANYEFVRNLFGDVIRIYDDNGDLKASYTYDAWGNHKVYNPDGTENTNTAFIGNINPIRYRGYYYDSESGLYYLMSRYYDPSVGQFISPDTQDYLDPETIGGVDLYAYCNNNPVMGYDPTGHWDWGTFWTGVGMIATAVTAIALVVTTLGAGTPLAISIVAGVTATAGVLTGINGIATVIEAGTDYNFVKDGVFQGNETAYNVYATITEGVAVVGSMILGGYQSTGRFKASKQGRELLGKGYKSVGKDRWVSKDGFRQMRMDKPHMYNGEKLNYHINLDTFKVNYWQNSRAPINRKIGLHLVYDFFSFIIK